MTQFHVFLICISCGFFGGVVYDLFYCLSYPWKKIRPVKIAADILFCLIFSGVFLLLSLKLHLPPFRFYLCLGLMGGLLLYWKSVHKLVAFSAEKVYNRIVQIFRKRRKEKQCRKKGIFLKKRKGASS